MTCITSVIFHHKSVTYILKVLHDLYIIELRLMLHNTYFKPSLINKGAIRQQVCHIYWTKLLFD